MQETLDEPKREFRSSLTPWGSVGMVLLSALFGFLILGPVVGYFMALPFYSGDAFSFLEDLMSPAGKDHMRIPSYVLQGAATVIGLAIFPTYMWARTNKAPISKLFEGPRLSAAVVLLLVGIVISFMGPNSFVAQWNAALDLPDFMGGFESWARRTENQAMEITRYLTTFDSFGMFVVGFFVIAVFPAVAEELVFRGMLQPALFSATKNKHVAIWVTAVLFSAFHLQFFGFFPRVLLGALFGYLYVWSGTLWVPIIAHFINNGLQVVVIYLVGGEMLGVDVNSTEALPIVPSLLMTAASIGLLFIFWKYTAGKQPSA